MKPDEIRKKAKGIAWSDADDLSNLEDSIFKALIEVRDAALEEAAKVPHQGIAFGGYYGRGPQALSDAILALKSKI